MKVKAPFEAIFRGDDIGEDLRQFLRQHKGFGEEHIKDLILAVGDTYMGLSHVRQFANVGLEFWVDEKLKACWSFYITQKPGDQKDPFFCQMGETPKESYHHRRQFLGMGSSIFQDPSGSRQPHMGMIGQLPDRVLAELLGSFSLLQTQRIPLGLKGACPDAIELMDMVRQRLMFTIRGLGMFAQGGMNSQGFVTSPPVYGMGVGYPPECFAPAFNALPVWQQPGSTKMEFDVGKSAHEAAELLIIASEGEASKDWPNIGSLELFKKATIAASYNLRTPSRLNPITFGEPDKLVFWLATEGPDAGSWAITLKYAEDLEIPTQVITRGKV